MPNEEISGDGADESEAVVLGTGDVSTENAFCMLPMATGTIARVVAQEAKCGGDVGVGHIRTIEEFANEGGEREGLDIERGWSRGGRSSSVSWI